jgi:hypothetical protein
MTPSVVIKSIIVAAKAAIRFAQDTLQTSSFEASFDAYEKAEDIVRNVRGQVADVHKLIQTRRYIDQDIALLRRIAQAAELAGHAALEAGFALSTFATDAEIEEVKATLAKAEVALAKLGIG